LVLVPWQLGPVPALVPAQGRLLVLVLELQVLELQVLELVLRLLVFSSYGWTSCTQQSRYPLCLP